MTHYEEHLQRDINLIRSKILAMAQLADRALRYSLRALIEKNLTLAYSVVLRDQYIDELEKELDRLCLEFLVRQQPVAGICASPTRQSKSIWNWSGSAITPKASRGRC